MTHWLHWIASFLIVIGILSVAAGVQQWWEWRKENRK
jgi:uncharacterized membrane protein YidH (DUF202 family)